MGKKYFKKQLRAWSFGEIDINELINNFKQQIFTYPSSERGELINWLIWYVDRPTFTFPGKMVTTPLFPAEFREWTNDNSSWSRYSDDYKRLRAALWDLQKEYSTIDLSFSWKSSIQKIMNGIVNNPTLFFLNLLPLTTAFDLNYSVNPSDGSARSIQYFEKFNRILNSYALQMQTDVATLPLTGYVGQYGLATANEQLEKILNKAAQTHFFDQDPIQRSKFGKQTLDVCLDIEAEKYHPMPYATLYIGAYEFVKNPIYSLPKIDLAYTQAYAVDKNSLQMYNRIYKYARYHSNPENTYFRISKNIKSKNFDIIDFLVNFDDSRSVINLSPWVNAKDIVASVISTLAILETNSMDITRHAIATDTNRFETKAYLKKLEEKTVYNSHSSEIHYLIASKNYFPGEISQIEHLTIAVALDPTNLYAVQALIEHYQQHDVNMAMQFYRHKGALLAQASINGINAEEVTPIFLKQYADFLDEHYHTIDDLTYKTNPFRMATTPNDLRKLNDPNTLLEKMNALEQQAKHWKANPHEKYFSWYMSLFGSLNITLLLAFLFKDQRHTEAQITKPLLKSSREEILESTCEKIWHWDSQVISFGGIPLANVQIEQQELVFYFRLTFLQEIPYKVTIDFTHELLNTNLGQCVETGVLEQTQKNNASVKLTINLNKARHNLINTKLENMVNIINEKLSNYLLRETNNLINQFSMNKANLNKAIFEQKTYFEKLKTSIPTDYRNKEQLSKKITAHISELDVLTTQTNDLNLTLTGNEWEKYTNAQKKSVALAKEVKAISSSLDLISSQGQTIYSDLQKAAELKGRRQANQPIQTIRKTTTPSIKSESAKNATDENNNAATTIQVPEKLSVSEPKETKSPATEKEQKTQTNATNENVSNTLENKPVYIPPKFKTSNKERRNKPASSPAMVTQQLNPKIEQANMMTMDKITNNSTLQSCINLLTIVMDDGKNYPETPLDTTDRYAILLKLMNFFEKAQQLTTEFTEINDLLISKRSSKHIHNTLHYDRSLFDDMNLLPGIIQMTRSLHKALKNFQENCQLPQENTLAKQFDKFVRDLEAIKKSSFNPTIAKKRQDRRAFITPGLKANDSFFLEQIHERLGEFTYMLPKINFSETTFTEGILAFQQWITQLDEDIKSLSEPLKSNVHNYIFKVCDGCYPLHKVRNRSRHSDALLSNSEIQFMYPENEVISPQEVLDAVMMIKDKIDLIQTLIAEKLKESRPETKKEPAKVGKETKNLDDECNNNSPSFQK